MGGGPIYSPNPTAVLNPLNSVAPYNAQMQAAAMNIASQMQNANSQSAFNSGVHGARMEPIRYNPETEQFEKAVSSVAKTAASRVRKADWEVEEDRKDRELDEWLEASKQAVERAGDGSD